jgi:hypothetical protein
MELEPGPRHLSRETLREYLRAGSKVALTSGGDPATQFVIDPSQGEMELRVASEDLDLPDIAAFRHFEVSRKLIGGSEWSVLRIRGGADLLECYPVLSATADRIQLRGENFAEAVAGSLRALSDVLSRLSRLSTDQEVGLFGELLALRALVEQVGGSTAVSSWTGPLLEEHDFALESDDVEVKTTLSEQRIHMISSLTQLVPSPDRRLFLLSIQVSRGGAGGLTLAELIQEIHSLLEGSDRDEFAEKVRSAGWRSEDSDLYTERFTERTQHAFYRVDEAFPAITPKTIESIGSLSAFIRAVSYQIEVTSLKPTKPISEFRGLTPRGPI